MARTRTQVSHIHLPAFWCVSSPAELGHALAKPLSMLQAVHAGALQTLPAYLNESMSPAAARTGCWHHERLQHTKVALCKALVFAASSARASAPGAPEQWDNGFSDTDERLTSSMDAIREATKQLGRGESLLTPDMSSSQGIEQPGEPPSPAPESRHAPVVAPCTVFFQRSIPCIPLAQACSRTDLRQSLGPVDQCLLITKCWRCCRWPAGQQRVV